MNIHTLPPSVFDTLSMSPFSESHYTTTLSLTTSIQETPFIATEELLKQVSLSNPDSIHRNSDEMDACCRGNEISLMKLPETIRHWYQASDHPFPLKDLVDNPIAWDVINASLTKKRQDEFYSRKGINPLSTEEVFIANTPELLHKESIQSPSLSPDQKNVFPAAVIELPVSEEIIKRIFGGHPDLEKGDPGTFFSSYISSSWVLRKAIICLFEVALSQIEQLSGVKATYESLSYDRWPIYFQTALRSKFIHIVEVWRYAKQYNKIPYNLLEQSLTFNPDAQDFTLPEMQEIYLIYVAHTLFLDAYNIVPWKIIDYTFSEMERLLNSKYMFFFAGKRWGGENLFIFRVPTERFPPGSGEIQYYIDTEVNPIHPILVFYFLESRELINRSGEPTNPMAKAVSTAEQQIARLNSIVKAKLQMKSNTPNIIYTWKDDEWTQLPQHSQGIQKTISTVKRTISIIARWYMYNVRHSSRSNHYSNFLNYELQRSAPKPPLDRCLSLPIPFSRRSPPYHANVQVIRQYESNFSFDAKALFNTEGTLAGGITSMNLTWYRYSAYAGCHTASGMFYWLLRSINIPSKLIETPETLPNNPKNPSTNEGKHKGIAIFLPSLTKGFYGYPFISGEALYLYHTDILYNESDNWEPVIDPLNLFASKQEYDEWFGLPIKKTISGDFYLYNKKLAFEHGYSSRVGYNSFINSVLENSGMAKSSRLWGTSEYVDLLALIKEVNSERERQVINSQGIPPGFMGGFQAYQLSYFQYTKGYPDTKNEYLRQLGITPESIIINKIVKS